MVNVQKYQWVAIGDTVKECEKAYVTLLGTNGISDAKDESLYETISGRIAVAAPVVIDGNTHYYITLENSEEIFDVDMADPNLIGIIRYQAGDSIRMTYMPEESGMYTVTQIQ